MVPDNCRVKMEYGAAGCQCVTVRARQCGELQVHYAHVALYTAEPFFVASLQPF